MFSSVRNVNVFLPLLSQKVTLHVTKNEQERAEHMVKEPERKKWGVPVEKRKMDKCESHIILKESGKRKRPRKCLSPAVVVGIRWKGKEIWICGKCWKKMADMDLEWGEEKNE